MIIGAHENILEHMRLVELFLHLFSCPFILSFDSIIQTPIMQSKNDTSCVEGRDMLRRRTPTLVLNKYAAKCHNTERPLDVESEWLR